MYVHTYIQIDGTTPVDKTTTSSTVDTIEKETSPPPVQNGLRGQQHQPSAPTAEAGEVTCSTTPCNDNLYNEYMYMYCIYTYHIVLN